MDKKYHLIRGPRIIQQLDEAPYAELERNTMQFIPPSEKRQFAVNPIQIQKVELIPHAPSNALEARGAAMSNNNQYQPIIFFLEVEYQDEDTPENITFMGADGEEHHVAPISLRTNNCKVRCTCLDFRWRFAMHNQKTDTLHGPGPDLYQKVSNRPPNNPRGVAGLCKHLLKLAIELRNSGIVTV